MRIGRRIYYDKETGNVIVNTGQRQGFVKETTPERDKETYRALQDRDSDTFDYIELDYGEYDEDFSASNGYRIDPDNKELEFSYPDSDDDSDDSPDSDDYQEPLTDQIKEMIENDTDNKTALTESYETSEEALDKNTDVMVALTE